MPLMQDVMPLVLHFIEQLNHSAYNIFFNQQAITFCTFCVQMFTLNFHKGSIDREITSLQLYQTVSRACYAESVRQALLMYSAFLWHVLKIARDSVLSFLSSYHCTELRAPNCSVQSPFGNFRLLLYKV